MGTYRDLGYNFAFTEYVFGVVLLLCWVIPNIRKSKASTWLLVMGLFWLVAGWIRLPGHLGSVAIYTFVGIYFWVYYPKIVVRQAPPTQIELKLHKFNTVAWRILPFVLIPMTVSPMIKTPTIITLSESTISILQDKKTTSIERQSAVVVHGTTVEERPSTKHWATTVTTIMDPEPRGSESPDPNGRKQVEIDPDKGYWVSTGGWIYGDELIRRIQKWVPSRVNAPSN